jgi:hypothetical protein
MLDEALLNAGYDYDFTTINDAGRTFQRGQERYTRPCGWYRKAIRVLDKYEDGVWLGTGKDGWPVAYHGTSTANASQILRNGLFAGGSNGIPCPNGAAFGPGIYLSPNPSYSGGIRYSKPLQVDGRRYQIMYQVRVKSDAFKKHIQDVWTCVNSQDIRPYGILFKETST